jgi:hypothetical protein
MKTWMIALIVVLVLIVLAVIFLPRRRSSTTNAKSDAVNLIPDMVKEWPSPAPELAALLIRNCSEYSGNAVGWSFAHFGTVFGSALLSAVAALILKLNFITNADARADAAAICATLAALLITLSTAGDFKRKWQACRAAEVAVEKLAYDLFSQGQKADAKPILDQLTSLNIAYNLAIAGNEGKLESKA